MGINNEFAKRVVFDIETAPIEGAAEYVEDVQAPANYKDPEKIAAYVAEKRADAVASCGLDVDLCRVVAIGYQVEGDAPVALTAEDLSEAAMLRAFWTVAERRHVVGFNVLNFDLPVLIRRAQYLGEPVPELQIDKFKHPRVTDLQMVLSFNGVKRLRSLSFYVKRFGLDVPADPIDGSEIAALVAAGQWAAVRHHVATDIVKTAALAARLGYFNLSLAAELAAF